MELKRYSVGSVGKFESSSGPWVKYADAQAALAEKEAEVRRLVEDVSTGNAILAADVVRQYQRQLAEAERTIAFLKDAPAAELPRLVACAVIIRNDKVLLERRAPAGIEGLDNHWDIPGGKVEAGETPQQAAEREIHEELGIIVKATGLCSQPIPSVWTYPGKGKRHWLLVGVVCEIESGEPVLTDRLQWFPVAGLPDSICEADRTLVADAIQRNTAERTIERLKKAVEAAKKEIIASGNWGAMDYRWPEVRDLIDAALAPPAEAKEGGQK